MRYKEDQIPAEMLSANASDDMLFLTSIMGLFIGIALTIMGKMGKQLWMLVWGIGLVFASIYLWAFIVYDFKFFTHL